MARLLIPFCFFLFGTLPMYAQPAVSKRAGQPSTHIADSLINRELVRLSRLYKLDSASLAAYDKIITFDREVYVGKIHNITFSEVRFTCPPDSCIQALGRSRISQILYASGRRDVFMPLDDASVKHKELVDTARIIIRNQKDWMKVVVTEDPFDVSNLRILGEIKTRYEADIGNMNNEELMRHASVNLKKKAAALKAHYVLVETKFFTKPYGELPVVEVTARVFGYGGESRDKGRGTGDW
jgi:hypothetical protein